MASPKCRGRANLAEVREGHNPAGDEWSYRVRMGRVRSEAAYVYGGQVLTKSRNYSTTFRALPIAAVHGRSTPAEPLDSPSSRWCGQWRGPATCRLLSPQ